MRPTHPRLFTVADPAELQALWRVVAEAKFQAAPSDAALWGSPRVHALATNLADAMRRWHQPQGDTAAVEAHHRWINSLPANAVLPVQRAQLKKDAASRWWHAMTAAQQLGHVRSCAAPFAVDAADGADADFLDWLIAEAQSALPLQSAPPAPRATHDFDTMCWPDNAIHALRIEEGSDGIHGQLLLDIDHLESWLPDRLGGFDFKVVAADLVFHEVTDLRVAFDYAACSAALQPMCIDRIDRESITCDHSTAWFAWRIELGWPRGGLNCFNAAGFSHTPRSAAVTSSAQCLPADQRSM